MNVNLKVKFFVLLANPPATFFVMVNAFVFGLIDDGESPVLPAFLVYLFLNKSYLYTFEPPSVPGSAFPAFLAVAAVVLPAVVSTK